MCGWRPAGCRPRKMPRYATCKHITCDNEERPSCMPLGLKTCHHCRYCHCHYLHHHPPLTVAPLYYIHSLPQPRCLVKCPSCVALCCNSRCRVVLHGVLRCPLPPSLQAHTTSQHASTHHLPAGTHAHTLPLLARGAQALTLACCCLPVPAAAAACLCLQAVLARGVAQIPDSVKLWVAAARLERTDDARLRVLKKVWLTAWLAGSEWGTVGAHVHLCVCACGGGT